MPNIYKLNEDCYRSLNWFWRYNEDSVSRKIIYQSPKGESLDVYTFTYKTMWLKMMLNEWNALIKYEDHNGNYWDDTMENDFMYYDNIYNTLNDITNLKIELRAKSIIKLSMTYLNFNYPIMSDNTLTLK